jgi:hypothetical protein
MKLVATAAAQQYLTEQFSIRTLYPIEHAINECHNSKGLTTLNNAEHLLKILNAQEEVATKDNIRLRPANVEEAKNEIAAYAAENLQEEPRILSKFLQLFDYLVKLQIKVTAKNTKAEECFGRNIGEDVEQHLKAPTDIASIIKGFYEFFQKIIGLDKRLSKPIMESTGIKEYERFKK